MKRLFKAALFIFSVECSMQGMEPINLWEKAQSIGPLKALAFEEVEFDEATGKHFGWLQAQEFDDQVYVAVTIHEAGYYIDYVDPLYKISLPNGFYYWKKLNTIKVTHDLPFEYIVKNVRWSSSPAIIPTIDYDDNALDNSNYYQAIELIHTSSRLNRYEYLPSFKDAFDNCCSQVYLYEKIEPKIIEEKYGKLITQVGYLYMNLNEETKNKILKWIPESSYQILKSWLEDALKNSLVSEQMVADKNSRAYIMNKNRVINQFIIESITDAVRFEQSIDIYKILERIERLSPCSLKDRKKFENYLIERFFSWTDNRIVGLTAEGIINCNTGLLQWD